MVLRSYHVLAPSKLKLIAHNESFALLDLFALVAVHGTRLNYITAPFFGILVWPEACLGWTGKCAQTGNGTRIANDTQCISTFFTPRVLDQISNTSM